MIRISNINKKVENDSKATCQDQMGHNLCIDNVVKVIEGKYKVNSLK